MGNPKIKISLSHSKVQKVEEERNQVKANRNINSSLNYLPLPYKKKNIMKRQTTIIIMRIMEVITEAASGNNYRGCGNGRSNYRGHNNYQYPQYYTHDDGS